MLAYLYPQQSVFWSMVEFFLLLIWIWLLIVIFGDIFRSHDLGGWAKALWVIFVIVLPFLGILVYLIARGGKMQERASEQARLQKEAFDAQVRQAAGSSGSADELAKLVDLKDKGVLTDAEFQSPEGQAVELNALAWQGEVSASPCRLVRQVGFGLGADVVEEARYQVLDSAACSGDARVTQPLPSSEHQLVVSSRHKVA